MGAVLIIGASDGKYAFKKRETENSTFFSRTLLDCFVLIHVMKKTT